MVDPKDVCKGIEGAEVHTKPFIHLCLSNVFTDEDYHEILRFLPSSDEYVELRHKDAKLPDNTYSRLEFELTRDRLERLDVNHSRYWNDFTRALHHPSIARAFETKFMEAGCKVKLETNTILRLSLARDFPGYFIRPHQDIPSKLLTVQIYLPRDNKTAELGTNFYRIDEERVLRKDASVPFMMNSGYAFPVSEESWHGVDAIPPGVQERNSLMLVWYVDNAMAKLGATARQLLRSFSQVMHRIDQE